jgi:multidrug efflux pump subunit AcrA (membrane-fusion protein)
MNKRYKNKFNKNFSRENIMLRYLPCIIILFLITGCGNKQTTDKVPDPRKNTVTVSVTRIQKSGIAETSRIFGDIKPLYQVDIFSKVNGLIISEKVETGMNVSKGTVMAEVQQDIPGMEFSPVKVEATQQGIVTMDAVEVGSRVSPQQKLYTIQKIDQVYMQGKILETLLGRVKKGAPATVTSPAYPEEVFHGKISEILPTVDPVTRMGEIKILIANPEFRLKPGMYVETEITADTHPGLLVPLDAIIRRGASTYVFKIVNNIANLVKIDIGLTFGNQIEVKNSLQEGDLIVVIGQNLLNDGTPVRISEEK